MAHDEVWCCSCNVDVENDYRPSDDIGFKAGHNLTDPMQAFGYLENRVGLSNNWTRLFYKYEQQPSCPVCGNSSFLYCDKTIDPSRPEGVCVTKTYDSCTSGLRGPINATDRVNEANQWMPPGGRDVYKGLPGDGRHQTIDHQGGLNILSHELGKLPTMYHTFVLHEEIAQVPVLDVTCFTVLLFRLYYDLKRCLSIQERQSVIWGRARPPRQQPDLSMPYPRPRTAFMW